MNGSTFSNRVHISCNYSRIFCHPLLVQLPFGVVSWATDHSLVLVPCRNVPGKVTPALSPGFIGSSGRLVKSPVFTLYRGFLFSIESVAQLFEGLPSLLQSRSQLLVRRFGCGFQTFVGEYHAWGSSSFHQKNLSITLGYLLTVQFGRRAF